MKEKEEQGREAAASETEQRKQKTIELSRYLFHKHYCENDVEAIVSLFDDEFSWLGTGEQEYATGTEKVTAIFRQFAGMVPHCHISGEEYDVSGLSPDIYLCTGRLWISTDPSDCYLRVHQRFSLIFRWTKDTARCCHIHISNPYIEMADDDVGFPTRMARQTYDYIQEYIAAEKKQIALQTAELDSIYNTIPCAILRMSRQNGVYRLITFNHAMTELIGHTQEEAEALDWSRGFCECVIPEDLPRLQASLDILKKPGDSSSIDYQIRKPSGELIYASGINSLISEDDNGQVIQRISFDISRRIELEGILKRMSFEDSLTGLYNRNKFNQDMELFQNQPPARAGIVCMDVNGLKEINDRQGHRAGDALLQRTATHIRRIFGKKAYRIGGDEFVVIDTESGREAFLTSIEVARASLRQDQISISFGLSFCCDGKCNITRQIHEADRDMYAEKKKYYQQTGKRR